MRSRAFVRCSQGRTPLPLPRRPTGPSSALVLDDSARRAEHVESAVTRLLHRLSRWSYAPTLAVIAQDFHLVHLCAVSNMPACHSCTLTDFRPRSCGMDPRVKRFVAISVLTGAEIEIVDLRPEAIDVDLAPVSGVVIAAEIRASHQRAMRPLRVLRGARAGKTHSGCARHPRPRTRSSRLSFRQVGDAQTSSSRLTFSLSENTLFSAELSTRKNGKSRSPHLRRPRTRSSRLSFRPNVGVRTAPSIRRPRTRSSRLSFRHAALQLAPIDEIVREHALLG